VIVPFRCVAFESPGGDINAITPYGVVMVMVVVAEIATQELVIWREAFNTLI